MVASHNSSNLRPFLELAKGPLNKLRRSTGGGEPREVDREAQGKMLLLHIGSIGQQLSEARSKRAEYLPRLEDGRPQIILKASMTRKGVERAGIKVLEEGETDTGSHYFKGVPNDENLSELQSDVNAYLNEDTKDGKPRLRSRIEPIEAIRLALPQERMGSRLEYFLSSGGTIPMGSRAYDIEIAGGSAEDGEKHRRAFDKYLEGFKQLLPQDNESPSIYHYRELIVLFDTYSLHRVRLPYEVVEDLLGLSDAFWLLRIDLISRIEDDAIRLREVRAGSFPPLPQIASDAPRVVVIDSGIVAGHPLFTQDGNSIIGRQKTFLPPWLDKQQDVTDPVYMGHGTGVASVLAYNSVAKRILNRGNNHAPIFWIENAKILYSKFRNGEALHEEEDQAALHELLVPSWLMQQIVEEFHAPLPEKCKIFNLSVGSAPHPLQRIQSSWSEMIDILSAQNDVLFVVASGNLNITEVQDLQSNASYPDYLLNKNCRLRDPSQAHNALTVGAISESDTLGVQNRKFSDAIGKENGPAPFTRTGLRNSDVIKPDVVENGGNLMLNGLGSISDHVPELAVPIANPRFATSNPIAFACGTSFAAPKVAHLAGRIQAVHPRFSANLIRALIVNSATWPEYPPAQLVTTTSSPNDLDENNIKRTKLQLYGYGVPDLEKSIGSNTSCITLYTEGEFQWNPTLKKDRTSGNRYASKVSFYKATLEMDNLLKTELWDEKVRVSITLAYNPLVRKTDYRYQAVEMYWELKRPLEQSHNFEKRLQKEGGEAETPREDKTPWAIRPILASGNKKRRGTVIKDWFDIPLSNLRDLFEIAITATVNDWYMPPMPLTQSFALVLSVESLRRMNIYDRVQVRVPMPVRVQL